MPLEATYDKSADALYIKLAEGQIARSIEVDDSHFIDLDESENPLGVELLYPGRGMNLKALAERIGVPASELFEAANRALLEANAYAAPTRTVSTALAMPYAVVTSPFEARKAPDDVTDGSVSYGGVPDLQEQLTGR